jgi:hypothetical protein
VSEKKIIIDDYKNNNLAIGCYHFQNFKYFDTFFNSISFRKKTKKKEIYVINLLDFFLKTKKKINHFNLNKFVHLGVPNQYENFIDWKNIIHEKTKKKINSNFPSVMLMAGKGERVKDLKEKKPFLKFKGQKIYEYIFKKFGSKKNYIITNKNYSNSIKKKFKSYKINNSKSMLQTIEKSIDFLNDKKNFYILSCDCFGNFENLKFKKFIKSKNPDVVLFTFKISDLQRTLSNSHTTIKLFKNRIKSINVKKFTNDKNEFGHAGFFWVKNKNIFNNLKKFSLNNKLNREILLDDYFKFLFDKKICKVNYFKLNEYIHIGSVKEYSELKYWENYFSHED